MLRSFQRFFCLLCLVGGLQQAKAFSLLGEFDDWQLPETGFGFGEIGGSKSIGEEFRLNTPVITYGFDSTFLDFFGPEGVKAVDKAFAIMNKIPPASRMSTNLTEFLLDDAQRVHPTPETLNLMDLKSITLGLLIEHMGLAGEEHVFDLRKRIPFSSPIPCQFDYQVMLRNFDPVPLYPFPTRDVNGVTYGYIIIDSCPAASIAFAEETLVDPTDFPFNSVASFKGGSVGGGVLFGGFYMNITRDDAGGLRHMYRRNNFNNEVLPTDARPLAFSGPWQPVDFFGTNNVTTNTLALRGGIEKVSFRKTRFNSTFGTFFKPIVQTYKVPVRTNDTTINQTVRRAIFLPDILFRAADLNNLPAANPSLTPSIASRRGSPRYLTNGTPIFSSQTSIGPGTVIPQTEITFHKAIPSFFNSTPFFLDNLTADTTFSFMWASFDGSTNDPVVYPQGTSIRDVERQVLLGIP